MKSIVIVGAGGFAREIYQWLCDQYGENAIKGFLSPNANDLDGFEISKPILGSEDSYVFSSDDEFILAFGSPKLRRIVGNKIKEKGGRFLNLIHPTAVVSSRSHIGEGVVICPFALVSPNAKIQDFSVINFYCSVAHDATLGKFAVLSPYATLNGHSKVEEEAFLGTGVSIAPSTVVGKGAKISAGVAITQNIDEYAFIPPSEIKVMKGFARFI